MKDNMKVEMEAHKNQQLERIVEHMDNMARLSNDTVQILTLQNTRLQAELDKIIHKLSDYEKVLREYANCEPIEIKRAYWNGVKSSINCTMADIGVYARETLKKWEDK